MLQFRCHFILKLFTNNNKKGREEGEKLHGIKREEVSVEMKYYVRTGMMRALYDNGMMGDAAWCCVVPRGAVLCCVVLRGAAWCCVVLRGAAWCCVVLRGTAWCCVVLRGTAWSCIVLRCAVCCCVVIRMDCWVYVVLTHICFHLLSLSLLGLLLESQSPVSTINKSSFNKRI